jgi:ABC-type transporter Mla subunit MlaD
MITVDINREALAIKNDEAVTLIEALQLVESQGLKDNEIITKIMIDEKPYNFEGLGELVNENIDSFDSLSIQVQTNYEIAFDALSDSNVYIDNLNSKISLIVQAYNENDLETANQNFSELIDLIDLFIQLISKVHRTVRSFNPNFFKDNDTIRNLEIHLLSILKALIPAKEKNDIIMLSDLLEYELADNLAQWKIKAIPLMLESRNK